MNDSTEEQYEGWAVLEIMGRRRRIGYLTRQAMFGRAFIRIDLPGDEPVTQFYSPESVYCITPVTEDTARQAASLNHIAPISRWELPAPPTPDGEPVTAEITDDEEEDHWK